MFSSSNISIIKKSCLFILEVVDFYDELILNGKKPIAVRVLSATLGGTMSLQKALYAKTKRDFVESKKLAIKHFKNVVYWLEQCERSGYYFDENLLKFSVEMLEFCEDEEFAV